MKVGRALWLGLCFLMASWQVAAQDSSLAPFEEYGKHLRAAEEVSPLQSNLFGDKTSLYNGSTEFDVTDIDLPGNSALPVRLSRRLVVDDRRLNPGNLGGFGDWDIDVPYIDGTFVNSDGWTVQGASNSQSNARCSVQTQPYTVVGGNINIVASPFVIWDGDQLHIPEGVDEELLKNTEVKLPAVADGRTYPWITKSLYRATCATNTANGYPGESFVIASPAGERYTFNYAQVNPMAGMTFTYANPTGTGNLSDSTGRSHIFLLATEVDDRFGNWVKYAYNSAGQLTQISANDGRAINIYWSGTYIDHATVTDQATGTTRTWNYGYTNVGALTYSPQGAPAVTINLLHTVTRPDNSTWNYNLTSGSFETSFASQDSEPPPQYHCQIDSNPNTGNMVYAIDSPSGAHGIFQFTYARSWRKYVPKTCTGTLPNERYPPVYDFFDNFQLASKQITGAGISTQSWTYNYASSVSGGYVEASVPFPYPSETYIPQSNSPYGAPKVVTVTDPSEITRYSFGVNYGVDEGRLYATEVDTLSGTPVKTTTNTYLADAAISSQTFPDNAGVSVQSIAKNPMVARLRPVVTTVTAQDGSTYTRQTNGFDVFVNPADVVRSNNIAGQSAIEEATTYFYDYADWVIGLPMQVTNVGNGDVESLNSYYPNATLQTSARFGETLLSYTYNAQGQLATFEDGNSQTTSLGNYYRGIPRLATYPDTTTQSAVVDDYGEITSVTDQNGHQTGYHYNAIGWPATIIYPANDEVAWYPTIYAFNYVTSAERGIPAGHWRLAITTGNYTQTTYFDAMLRPLITDSNFTNGSAVVAGSDITSATTYDWKGETLFTSYPQTGAWNVGDGAVSTGTHQAYDILGRVVQSQQDSELPNNPLLTTITAYLANNGTQVTDPNNNATTTYFQAFDEPSVKAPIKVIAPEGVTQTIVRDPYGSPTSITQSGVYQGTETDTVTKTLVYDI